jgi:serine/threonine protein kinase
LGVIIFEFLSGTPPFYDELQYKIYEKILTGKIDWPRYFDSSSKDIIKRLLNTDPSKRLGSGNCGIVGSNTSSSSANVGGVFLTQTDSQTNENESKAHESNMEKQDEESVIDKRKILKHKASMGSEEVKRHKWFISIADWNDVYERRLKPPFKPELSHEGDTRNFEKYETPDLTKAPVANEKQQSIFYNF